MLRTERPATCRLRWLAAAALWLAGAIATAAEPGRPEPSPAASGEEPPVFLLLDKPEDLDALLKGQAAPDFILKRGGPPPPPGEERPRARPPVVDAVDVRGDVRGDSAHLTIEFDAWLADEGPAWVPVRLDGQTVVEAREGPRDLPLRDARDSGGGWQVELAGAGRHRPRVDLLVPVRSTAEGRRIELAIPEAASTRIRLDVGPRVLDAVAGAGDRVAAEPIESGRRTRLSAHLTARGRLELTWRAEAEPGVSLPPLLEVRGEIAVAVDRGAARCRSSWDVRALRGTTRELRLRLDPEDKILAIERDGQALAIDPVRSEEDDAAILIVPLADPLRPEGTVRLSLTTQRPLPEGPSPRWTFRGVAFAQAAAQSGVLAVEPEADLWVSGTPGRGLWRLDLRDLPTTLRTAATSLAYKVADQPFELTLRAESAPPRVRVQSRTTAVLDAGQARLDTWLDYQVARGRVFEVQVGLPPGLVLDAAGPAEVVASYQWLPEIPGAAPPNLDEVPRSLTLLLTAEARDAKSFRIHLTGRQALDPDRPVALPLFQPRDAAAGGGRLAVLTARDVTVERLTAAGAGGAFESLEATPPEDWPWPPGSLRGGRPPALWLRHDGNPAALPLRLAVQPRTVHHETTLTARVERHRLDVVQETTCRVRFGTLSRLDVAVPAAVEGLWSLDPDAGAVAEFLRVDPDGRHRYRLSLTREVTDAVRLHFRYRLPLGLGLAPDQPTRVEIPWLRVLDGSTAPPKVQVAAEPGIDLAPAGGGWVLVPSALDEEARPARLTLRHPGDTTGSEEPPPAALATARTLAPLPPTVAARLWLRTLQAPDGSRRTTAWYAVEVHAGTLAVALPPNAEWIRARVGGEAVAEVERQGPGHRLRLPAGGPVLVGLEYAIPASRAAGAWIPPRLLDGGRVQQTLWEVQVPDNRALVGVPAGWADEDHWAWAGLAWGRRPSLDASALMGWVAGPSAGRPAVAAADVGRGGFHGYLFSRPGDPGPLRPWIVPYAWLIGACSAAALGLGLLISAVRPGARLPWLTAPALAVAVAAATWPGEALLMIQASSLGVALTLTSLGVRHLIERRRPGASPFAEPSTRTGPAGRGSSASFVVAGSDASTAIRPRPGTTLDHHPTFPAPAERTPTEEPEESFRSP